MRLEATASEAILWQALRRDALGVRFRRQVVLGPFIVDFFAPSQRLVVEVDGAIHLNRRDVDRLRDEALVARGLRVVRITADVVETDLAAALLIVRRALVAA
jgi:very-short-patch-repair endonuclease